MGCYLAVVLQQPLHVYRKRDRPLNRAHDRPDVKTAGLVNWLGRWSLPFAMRGINIRVAFFT